MPKIAFIGAGSTVFTRNLTSDILAYPELRDSTELALMDIDQERLRTSAVVAQSVAASKRSRARITTTLDRRRAIDEADYVFTTFQIGGLQATRTDFDLPRRFGLRQTIADTVGIGGIMRGLRTIPVLVDLCRDMEELCPQALLMQYSNPMAMNCWAITASSDIKTIGLCHSVPHTVQELAADLELPAAEIEFVCAGINHVAFYLKLEHKGRDLYPGLWRIIDEGRVPAGNRVRYEVLRHFGYFVTESSEHFAEYTPWFIKSSRPDLIERFDIPLDEYLVRSKRQHAEWNELYDRLSHGDGEIETLQSREYGGPIIHALETGRPFNFNGNVPNDHDGNRLITNLSSDACVEVPCIADETGIHPDSVGALPPQLAGIAESNITVQRLAVLAALTGNRAYVYQAAALDPHTGAELDLDEIHGLVDQLIEEHGDLLPPLTSPSAGLPEG
jgi:alpha-galactosidase